MAQKNLETLRKGDEFVGYAASKGAEIRYGSGSHVMVITPKGRCPVPCHKGKDIGKGLRVKIVKLFLAMGLVFMVACYVFCQAAQAGMIR